MPNCTGSAPTVETHCNQCNEPDTDRMVSCCHCDSWWHFTCVGVNDSIDATDRPFTCPNCQRPSAQIPVIDAPGSKANSKAGTSTSTCSAGAIRARLQLERLEAQKALAMKRIELERREHERKMEQEKQKKEAEFERRQLQLEQAVMNESFRLREVIDLGGEGDEDNRSVASVQSSFSKVQQWKVAHSTLVVPTEKAPAIGTSNATTATGIQARQDGMQQPTSINEGILEAALAGISLGQSGLEPTLGGIIGRAESTTAPIVGSGQANIFSVTSALAGPSKGIANVIPKQHAFQNYPFPLTQPPPAGNSFVIPRVGNPNFAIAAQSTAVNRDSAGPIRGPVTVEELLGGEYSQSYAGQPLPSVIPTEQRFSRRQTVPPGIQLGPQEQPRFAEFQAGAQQPPLHDEQAYWGPTPRQLAARHVMNKELPIFSGNPEDWPLFISSYVNSTQTCGFSNEENLARLQRCLKGHALESVRSRLLLPASVPNVLATLETLYGRPELLIHALLQRIRGVPAPKQERLDTLIGFGMAVQNFCDHLEAGRHEAHLNNPMLLFELVEKLPAHMKLDWSLYKQRCGEVNLRSFSQYMQTLVRAASDVTVNYDPRPQPVQQQRIVKEKNGKDKNFCGTHSMEDSSLMATNKEASGVTMRPSSPACFICKNSGHRVKDCSEFDKKTVDERWETIQKLGLCRLCLGAHGRRPCKNRKQCDIDGCQRRHHPLLHSKRDTNEAQQARENGKTPGNGCKKFGNDGNSAKNGSRQESSEAKTSSSKAVTNHHSAGKTTLFRIIPVTLYGNNRSVSVYAFLDDGSERTLIDEELVKDLGVVGDPQPLCLQWTANVKRSEANSQRVALEIAGRSGASKHSLSDVRTVSKLDLPRQSLRYAELAETFPYLKGLPIDDYDQAVPRILIGNDNAHVTSTLKLRDGRPGEPIAAKSRLGWTVYGSNQDKSGDIVHSFHICECQEAEQTLHELVEKFFSVESLGIMEVAHPESAETQRANQILMETTKRVGQRFETGLLWKYDSFEFPDSYQMAVRRLQCLERRMQRDLLIGESVRRQLSEYQAKGYIHKATRKELDDSDPRRTWYLPLGVVINPKKPSKVRIFCDAAAKVDGVALNTMLLKGPDLLNTLLNVLYGFREKRVALCADLKEMFHQIRIRREDRHAQQLLWRDDPTQAPDVYLMDVATFGATCSPCSAQFVKNLNAKEHSRQYPVAADAIIRKHYVDDYLDSADDVDEAVKLAHEVKLVHSLGGFHLRNWLSNSTEVLARVGERDPVTEKCLQLDKNSSTERVLGMYWKPVDDVFTFTTTLAVGAEHPTKRQALRVVMSPFDPAGLLCFFLIHGKVLIQELWRAKTTWDQLIPEELLGKWMRWTSLFKHLDQISIPRCYFPQRSVKDILSLQLHIYVDASEEAYACVAYFRAVFPDGISVALVGGKSKVAPLKAHSIPRLELMAAVIGVRLMKTILTGHSLVVEKTVLWCDSKTVLAWINSDHRRYRQFVACRVGEILSKSEAKQWRWISSRKNVADDATKWGKGPCLSSGGRWFRGDNDLYLPEDQWTIDADSVGATTDEELRSCLVHKEVIVPPQLVRWERFSKLTHLYRSVAHVHRYVQNLRRTVKRETRLDGPLTQEELATVETTIFRWVQCEQYPDEVATLSVMRDKQPGQQARLEKTSKIYKLSPYLDEAGVIRSDGRISAATVAAFDAKFPVILPKAHPVTRLLVEWYHQRFLHANGETVVNEVRQRFHISQLRPFVRKVAKECALCKVKKPSLATPRMAPLPAARLQAYVRPFSYVGVDYFGPIGVRVNRSIAKRWVALFTCMTTRAIHLEVAHTLSTESCKMAIRRFIGRRGAPVEIRSDRGTNFVGSSNELKQEMGKIERQLAETFTNANTKWVFNPPGSPHMGGAWERLVRSVKIALAAMESSRTPNEETLATLLVEAESVVNSRPLTYIPLETAQQEALTPNHFLLMSSSGVTQTPKTLTDPRQACRNDWNLCRTMVDQFWRRWVREYLPTIARRTKWFEETKPIEVGDSVIIVEEKIRNGWIRGRVAKVVVGRDGRVRDAVVQTPDGMVHRPVAKLARIDIEKVGLQPGTAEGKAEPEIANQPYGSGSVTVCPADPFQLHGLPPVGGQF
ncbi:uncharacterized protein LOC131680765 [Topomyia yanbarensis]|uniref:uncharacterized protein LOC131680765 n=1 Tax=Topomyia yanbarensis TaxID=2498891 RepID=UPI00273AA6B7|nr:uncharacterized protein LOC131680765 [Topomyia yanbarensis]